MSTRIINAYIHFIETDTWRTIAREKVSSVPREGDTLRWGPEGHERYYRVDGVVFVYDEPECPFDRVNIGITRIEDDEA